MEQNTANESRIVFCLMYTVQQETCFICGILDPYKTAPRARAALKTYTDQLISKDYALIARDNNNVKLYRKCDNQEFNIYIEERIIQ